uniref:Formin-like protein n=1 Tax=Ananas comosus var. bracteatus TaxID=296719 RepID=A0A6V7Q6U0_ANACO|nr:unnamed protein product [Ananas comosus var. bracteatus]
MPPLRFHPSSAVAAALNLQGPKPDRPTAAAAVDTAAIPPCSECGRRFASSKALFGHMRCHPERQWRGINPRPSSATAPSAPAPMPPMPPMPTPAPTPSSSRKRSARSPPASSCSRAAATAAAAAPRGAVISAVVVPSTNPSPPSPSLLLLPPNSPSSPHYLRLLPLQLPFPTHSPRHHLLLPTHHHRHHHASSLLPAILLPILSLLALALSVAFFFDHGLCSPSSAPPRLKPSLPPAAASPDLLPIPPLPRPPAAAAALSSSEDEFFSPRAPAAMTGNSISRRDAAAAAAAAEKCGSQNSILSTPPYPSSPSPGRSSRRSECPKTAMPQLPIPPPPPPPPPPPVGFWESRVRKHDAHHLPALMPPRTVGLRNSAAAVFPAQPSQDLDAAARNERVPRPKLKPLHWDKVRASPDRVTVWDQLRSSSFHVNEEMIESLFVCNATNTDSKVRMKKPGLLPRPNQEKRVLDPKKSQNIAILLRALNVTKEEVCEALLEGNTDNLGTELLETLLKMAPSKEEEIKLKEYKDGSELKLGPAENFLKAVLEIPFAFKRVEAMLYIANFDSEVKYLKKSFNTLEAACEELRSSRLFMKLLEAVLKTGNRMNIGTNRGDAHAFKLDTLLKLVDIKGADGKTTVLHFVVQEIIKSEGSHLSTNLESELANVKKAASMDSNILSSYVSNLSKGIRRIVEVLKLNEESSSKNSHRKFHDAVNTFLNKAEEEIIKIQAQESVALSLVKEITEYFHGDSAKEESHPFRIFMVVRDFLAVLDLVCKEVEKINEHQIANSSRQSQVPVNPKFHALRSVNSDDGVHHHHHDLS